MSKIFFHLFHLLFNTVFIFFVLSFAIQCLIIILRIKNPRAKACLRLIPIGKILLDIFFYKFAYKFFYNLNPFGCKTYLNKCLHHCVSASFLETPGTGLILASLFIGITLFFLGRKLRQIAQSQHSLRSILSQSSLSCRDIENPQLKGALLKAKTKIMVSQEIQIPFATASSHIVLPASLERSLNQEEFEAILSHELGHIRSKDPLFKIVLSLLVSLLWWMPLKWWVKMIEKEQEAACDLEIHRYQISSLALAEGIVKTLSSVKQRAATPLLVCSALHMRNSHVMRLKNILNRQSGSLKVSYLRGSVALCLIALPLFSVWIC